MLWEQSCVWYLFDIPIVASGNGENVDHQTTVGHRRSHIADERYAVIICSVVHQRTSQAGAVVPVPIAAEKVDPAAN
jgi:hypothetical protein